MVTEAQVSAFEKRLGHALPVGYRRFLLDVNGGVPVPAQTQTGNVRACDFFSLDHPNDTFNVELRNQYLGDHPSQDLLFFASADGDRFLLAITGTHRGEVWAQDGVNPRPEGSNPRVLWHDRRDMKKIADSFDEFLAALGPLSK